MHTGLDVSKPVLVTFLEQMKETWDFPREKSISTPAGRWECRWRCHKWGTQKSQRKADLQVWFGKLCFIKKDFERPRLIFVAFIDGQVTSDSISCSYMISEFCFDSRNLYYPTNSSGKSPCSLKIYTYNLCKRCTVYTIKLFLDCVGHRALAPLALIWGLGKSVHVAEKLYIKPFSLFLSFFLSVCAKNGAHEGKVEILEFVAEIPGHMCYVSWLILFNPLGVSENYLQSLDSIIFFLPQCTSTTWDNLLFCLTSKCPCAHSIVL